MILISRALLMPRSRCLFLIRSWQDLPLWSGPAFGSASFPFVVWCRTHDEVMRAYRTYDAATLGRREFEAERDAFERERGQS